jgi:hypothetical protein
MEWLVFDHCYTNSSGKNSIIKPHPKSISSEEGLVHLTFSCIKFHRISE